MVPVGLQSPKKPDKPVFPNVRISVRIHHLRHLLAIERSEPGLYQLKGLFSKIVLSYIVSVKGAGVYRDLQVNPLTNNNSNKSLLYCSTPLKVKCD